MLWHTKRGKIIMENYFNLPEENQQKYLECLIILIENDFDDPEKLKALMNVLKEMSRNDRVDQLNR